MEPIAVRRHGARGPALVVLHGGPAAPGSVLALAAALGDEFRVLEPFQRRSGAVPLTVAQHAADLAEVMDGPETVIGWSWGAMLGLAFAAAHPELVRALVLIGCGTFDDASRALYHEAVRARGDDQPRRAPDFDADGFAETWGDVLRRQAAGIDPQCFVSISAPVLMLHGNEDPHPGPATRDLLLHYVPQLEYRELAGGHTPWEEPAARDEFFRELRSWLATHA